LNKKRATGAFFQSSKYRVQVQSTEFKVQMMCPPFGGRFYLLDCHAALRLLAMTLFFVHVSPADFVLAATFAYRSVSLRV